MKSLIAKHYQAPYFLHKYFGVARCFSYKTRTKRAGIHNICGDQAMRHDSECHYNTPLQIILAFHFRLWLIFCFAILSRSFLRL
jgi:hypothetical protein